MSITLSTIAPILFLSTPERRLISGSRYYRALSVCRRSILVLLCDKQLTPTEPRRAAAREALAHDSGQYGSNRGAEPLLDAFLKHIEVLGFSGYGHANLSIGIGAKQVLYLSLIHI